jgi:Na+-transporting NADH:ubiquinone oxidoreductase subunit C
MNRRFYSVLFMFLITLVFASGVTLVQRAHNNKITANKEAKLQKVILEVLNIPVAPAVGNDDLALLFENNIKISRLSDRALYTAFEQDDQPPRAYAFRVSGPGFWGPISAMVAVDATASTIINIDFYQHRETPGLGGRITEPWFKKQFADLVLDSGARPYFTLTPAALRKRPGELDAITGATQTSRAIDAFLNRELNNIIKELNTGKKEG